MERILKIKPLVLFLLCLFLFSTIPACGSKTVDFEVAYGIEGTKNNQYFAVGADALLSSLNDKLSDANCSLSIKDSGHEQSVYFSENGDTWKINVSVFTGDDVKSAGYARLAPSSDPATWVGYIHEVELSLFSDGNEAAIRNGQYIRALIGAFTPGAEELVESELGIYGDPGENATITEGVYRITAENVVYTYKKGSGPYSGGSLIITPHDEGLYEKANEETVSAIRPQ